MGLWFWIISRGREGKLESYERSKEGRRNVTIKERVGLLGRAFASFFREAGERQKCSSQGNELNGI